MGLIPENRVRQRFSRWPTRWFSYAVIISTLCLGQTTASGEDPIRPAEKPRAAATITPWDWSYNHPEDDHHVSCAVVFQGVMIGSAHDGDENGDTRYRCGKVRQFIDLNPVEMAWSLNQNESDHAYDCPPNTVMTGREHIGDENGATRYECAKLKDDWGNDIQVIPGERIDAGDFEGSNFECPENQVLVHRGHRGDTESGNVYYKCATLW